MKTFAVFALVTIITFVTVGVASYQVTLAILRTAPQENNERVLHTVKAVCDYAHDHTTGESEDACAEAQDASNTEYLCKYAPQSTADCWVEDKN